MGLQPGLHFPAQMRTPTTAGVVSESTQLPNGDWQYRLADGQALEIDYDHTTSLLGGPQIRRLLLAGTDPDGRPWVAGVSPWDAAGRPEGCFWLPSQGRQIDRWIDTTAGLRLPKAGHFDPGDSVRGEFGSDLGGFCLNEVGEVTSYDSR